MSIMDKSQVISDILDRNLEELSEWKPAVLSPGIGPVHPAVHMEFKQRLDSCRTNLTNTLNNIGVESLVAEYSHSAYSSLNPLNQLNGIHFELVKELQFLKANMPPWFGCGWCENSRKLDVDYWCAATQVRIDEAALMIVGVDPRCAQYDGLFTAYGNDFRVNENLYFLEDIFELLVRQYGDPEHGAVWISCHDLCGWVNKTGLKVSFELQKLFERVRSEFGAAGVSTMVEPEAVKLHGNSKLMFQRLLLTLAVEFYGLKGHAGAAKVARKMVSAGDFLGFNLDSANIAKQIRAGYGQLSEDAKAEIVKRHDEK